MLQPEAFYKEGHKKTSREPKPFARFKKEQTSLFMGNHFNRCNVTGHNLRDHILKFNGRRLPNQRMQPNRRRTTVYFDSFTDSVKKSQRKFAPISL